MATADTTQSANPQADAQYAADYAKQQAMAATNVAHGLGIAPTILWEAYA
jgi:hypothetical protein